MFYIFHGDDDHSQKATLESLIAKLGDPGLLDLNTTRLTGSVSFSELRQACGAMPFLAPARIVIVEDLLCGKPGKALLKQLADYLPQLPESTRLVFLESQTLRAQHPLLALAQAAPNGYAKAFERPEGGRLDRWIQERVAEKNGRITPRAAHLLGANVGNDLRILDNEIEKLVLYAGAEAEITPEDVTLLSPYVAEASIFELVDALGNRNGKKAAALLQEKLNAGADPFYLFAMFVRQFRLLIQVKELAEAGHNPPAMARELRTHAFVVGKIYQQSRGFSLAQLEQVYGHLLEIDVGVKTGTQDIHTALNLLVANLTVTA